MRMKQLPVISVMLVLTTLGCQRTIELQCYEVDPHSPVVQSEIEDPVGFVTTDYCGHGATTRDGLERHLTAYCVPKPEAGCDPCMFTFEEVETEFRAHIEGVFDVVGCPSDYEPEEIVPGCVAEWVETNECCWAGEYFIDPQVCSIESLP